MVSDPIDSGGWHIKSPVREFLGAGSKRERDYIIAGAGPLILFRTDNLILEPQHHGDLDQYPVT
jgi:hypothetical protein